MSHSAAHCRAQRAWRVCCALACAAGLVGAAPAVAQRAGSDIANTAMLSWTSGDAVMGVRSNTNTLRVAERLDVTLVANGPLQRGDGLFTGRMVLTNTGNGEEAFAIDSDAGTLGRVRAVGIDRNGDGTLQSSEVIADGRTAVLPSGASVVLSVEIEPGSESATGTFTLVARAITGSGAPGTLFAGRGDGDSDAIVGPTGAAARVQLAPPSARPAALPTLVKSQAVTDPQGGGRPVRGATITYTLDANLPSGTPAAMLSDPIPLGTRYLPGSLQLDGAALADAGHADGVSIQVPLPAASVPARHLIRFQVIIQ